MENILNRNCYTTSVQEVFTSTSLMAAGYILLFNYSDVARLFGVVSFSLGLYQIAGGSKMGLVTGVGAALFVLGSVQEYRNLNRNAMENLDESGVSENYLDKILQGDSKTKSMLYVGAALLSIGISYNSDNFNLVKFVLMIVAFGVILFTRRNYLNALVKTENVQKNLLAHILSYLLLAVAGSYSC